MRCNSIFFNLPQGSTLGQWCFITILSFSFLSLGRSEVLAVPVFNVDQTSLPMAVGGNALNFSAGNSGQQFMPAFSQLDVVEMMLEDNDPGDATGATVAVNIYAGSDNTGTLLGSSLSETLPNGLGTGVYPEGDLVFFAFAAPLNITPSVMHFIELDLISGDIHFGFHGNGNTYADGTALASGSDAGGDAWFQTGLLIPEPTTLALAGLGLSIVAMRRRR